MSELSIARTAPDPQTLSGRAQAIKERSTRGLLILNGGGVRHLEGGQWLVKGNDGNRYRVNIDQETRNCPDWSFFGREYDVPCKHIFAASLGLASRRGGVQVRTLPTVIAGDPFAHAAKRRGCSLCFGGYVSITVEEDGVEVFEAVPCKRCARESSNGKIGIRL